MGRLIYLLPIAFLAVFYFYPLWSILRLSLAPAGELDFGALSGLFSTDYYARTFVFTVGQSVLSTILTVAAALPAAYVFSRFRFPGKTLLLSAATLPFVLPTVVVAAAFSALIGERGVLNQLLQSLLMLDGPPLRLERTLAIILIVHVFYNFSVALRILVGYWSTQSQRIEEAARVLGASGWRLWWHVRLPMLRPAIFASGLLIFIFTFTSFGVILILGGARFATLEVEIYFQAVSLFNLPTAALLSLIQIGTMLSVMTAYTRLQANAPRPELARSQSIQRRPETIRERVLVSMTAAGIIGFLVMPLAALALRAFSAGGSLTLQNFAALSGNPRGSVLFVPPTTAILNSLGIATVTMCMALVLGLISAHLLNQRSGWRGAFLDVIFMLPLATSAVTLGFGFLITMGEPHFNLRSSPLLLPLAHTLVALPFVVRSVLPALRAIPPNVLGAASVLGASAIQKWRLVIMPLIWRGLAVGATFAFTVSIGEFGASAFIARPDNPTIPVVIFRLLGQPGASNYGQAMAMSVVLLAVCAVCFIAIEQARTPGTGEF
ncbi:iron ABC transporter permease [Kamptonema cortianum]|nr:iron ABC transporter permease [Kamptonema cortianum]